MHTHGYSPMPAHAVVYVVMAHELTQVTPRNFTWFHLRCQHWGQA